MIHMNVFRVLADISHTISKCILIWAIHSNRSAEGVSLITQGLYALVFTTRYLDLFWTSPTNPSLWNFILKIFYITSSYYILAIMMKVFARTREQEKAWKLGALCLGPSILLGPLLALLARGKLTDLFEVLWTFSIVLESVCVIPQLLLLRQTSVPTVIDSGYIIFLGSYRALYLLNWTMRFATKGEPNPDWRAVTFGIIQTALYADFAWVYWTRQRVKLRNGGVVDQDDLTRGFLVGKIFGRAGADGDVESGHAPEAQNGSINSTTRQGRWGKRGISVSADDDMNQEARENTKNASKDRNEDLSEFIDEESDDESPRNQQETTGLVRGQQ